MDKLIPPPPRRPGGDFHERRDQADFRHPRRQRGAGESGSSSDIFDKFRMLAGTVFKKDKVERILEKIDNLEKVKDISELNGLLIQTK